MIVEFYMSWCQVVSPNLSGCFHSEDSEAALHPLLHTEKSNVNGFLFVLHYFNLVGRCIKGSIVVKINTQKMEATATVWIATTIAWMLKCGFCLELHNS